MARVSIYHNVRSFPRLFAWYHTILVSAYSLPFPASSVRSSGVELVEEEEEEEKEEKSFSFFFPFFFFFPFPFFFFLPFLFLSSFLFSSSLLFPPLTMTRAGCMSKLPDKRASSRSYGHTTPPPFLPTSGMSTWA
ncbi:hypothetical protein HOY80DRAFT_993268 [Tuber brumale]|nr:hypothetical protein HOY80DRAFT_993268 [Tuber brumale]